MLPRPASKTLDPHWTHTPSTPPGAPVYVIDDESEVRRSLHFLLSTIGLVSWPFASAQDFLDSFSTLEPSPILLDIRMPTIDGLQLMAIMRERGINWPVIVISAHADIQVAVKAIKLGAGDFLEKPFKFEELELCLESAFARLDELNNGFAARDAARIALASLSPREVEVMDVLMRGIPNKTAAHMLDLSVRTVEMHRANALAKLQVKTIAEVIRLTESAELDHKKSIQSTRNEPDMSV